MELSITTYILDSDRNLKKILDLPDPRRRRLHSFEGVGDGQ